MIAASNYIKDLEQLILDFEDAHADLVGAEAYVYDASQALASVKGQFEVSRAEKLAEGIDGKNSEQREANLRLALHDLYQEQFVCESEVSRVKLQAEVKRKAWDMLRYKLRALEAISRFE